MKQSNRMRPIAVSISKIIGSFEAGFTANTQSKKVLPLGAMLAAIAFSGNGYAAEVVVANESVAANTKDASAQTMSAVDVKSTVVKQDGYQATKTRVGKVLQDPHDIPQAVTTVTRQLMNDQQVGSLREALRNVSGLTFNAAEGGRAGDNMMLRGFYTFGDIYLDGIRDTAQYNRETFNLEQIDVLRGSAAMLFGRGQAGGVINQVSKTAKLNDNNRITGSLGDYGYKQFTGDFNKQISDTIAIRLNVMDREEEATRKNPANGDRPLTDRKGVALSIGAGIGTDNEFFFNHVYTQTRDQPDFGIRFTNGRTNERFSSSTYWGGKKNYDDSDTHITTATFTHKFSEDTQWRTQLRSADYERDYWAKTPAVTAPTATLTSGGNQVRKLDYETKMLQTDIISKVELLGMKHELLAGFEFLHENSELYRSNVNVGTALDPYFVNVVPGTNFTTFKSNSKGYFVQDSIEFIPKWNLLLGARRDDMGANYDNQAVAKIPKLNYDEWSYRTGVSWHQTPSNHYYLTYSDSFSPTADLYQQTVVPLKPERSETTELGAKWLFFDGDLAFRTAIYRSIKDWERNTDLASNTAPLLTKKRRTDGLEFELAGRINEYWEVFGGIAFMDARILKTATNNDGNDAGTAEDVADVRFEGKRARNTPPVTFNIWTTYKFAGNWKVGGGVEAKGERFGYNPSSQAGPFVNGEFNPNTLPGYARVDALVAYEELKWAVRLNIKNLLDKDYADALYDNGTFYVPGNRRAAILTTEFKF